MGVTTSPPVAPYQPPAPMPGVPPSGIASSPIGAMADRAKQTVSNRHQNFLAMVRANTPQAATSEQKWANAAANLSVNQPLIDKFVDWVLYG